MLYESVTIPGSVVDGYVKQVFFPQKHHHDGYITSIEECGVFDIVQTEQTSHTENNNNSENTHLPTRFTMSPRAASRGRVENGRAMCSVTVDTDKDVLWHTHPVGICPFPSAEDVAVSMAKKENGGPTPMAQIIVCKFGIWVICRTPVCSDLNCSTIVPAAPYFDSYEKAVSVIHKRVVAPCIDRYDGKTETLDRFYNGIASQFIQSCVSLCGGHDHIFIHFHPADFDPNVPCENVKLLLPVYLFN